MKLKGVILTFVVWLPNARAAALPPLLGLRLARLKANLTVGHRSHPTPTANNGSVDGTCMDIEDLRVSKDQKSVPAVGVDTDKPMTLDLCYSFCSHTKSMYYGVQGGKMCVCFDEYSPTGKPPNCNAPCEGNSSQVCGGMDLSAYSVEIFHAWTKALEPKPCTSPAVQHAEQTCTEGGVGGGRGCEVECEPGYRLGSNTLICDTVRGKWVGVATCAPVTCSAPPRIPNAARVCSHSSTVENGGICEVVCLPGFELSENSLTCTAAADDRVKTGVYNGHAYCKAKSCGVPQSRILASSVTHEVLYPSIITYTCKSGATLDGTPGGPNSYQVQCQESGAFSETDQQCKPMPCSNPPVVEHANRAGGSDTSSSFKGTWLYPMFAEYECETGYSTDGTGAGARTFRSACMASGHFTEPPKCLLISCGPALSLKNSEAQVNDKARVRYYSEHLGYECDKGYALEKTNIADNAFDSTCEDTGIYSGVKLCTAVTCGTPPVIDHASGPVTEIFYPSTVAYNCEEGYSVGGNVTDPGQFSIDCKDNGKFSPTQVCEPIRCAAPPTFEHTTLKGGATAGEIVVYPNVLEYTCEDGYSTDRSESEGAKVWTMQCLPNGQFSSHKPCLNIDDCVGHTCGPFGSCVDHLKNYTCDCSSGFEQRFDEDGELLCGNINDCGPMACGSGGRCQDLINDYTCECDDGYELTMMDTDKVCARIECGAPPEVQHSTAPGVKALFEDIVDYACDAGYTTDGTVEGSPGFSIECLSSGSFTPTQTCQPVACGYPAAIDHSTVVVNKSTVFDQQVMYRCDKGFSTDGTVLGKRNFSIECTATGKFSSSLQCVPVSCGPPKGIARASVAPINQALHYLQTASYVCDEGYSVEEARPERKTFEAICRANGIYSGLRTCEPVACELGSLDVAKDNVTIIYEDEVESNVVHFLDEVTVPCSTGYTTTGEASSDTAFVGTCTAEGKLVFNGFKLEDVKCKKVKCKGALPEVPHSRAGALPGIPVFGDTVQFTCDSGYAVSQVLSHAPTITAGGEYPTTTFSIECLSTGAFSQGFYCANIDDCVGHTCGPHGTCVDGLNDYSCDCQEGYEQNTLEDGEKVCGNIDDCGTHACGEHGVCIDLVSDYTCECEAGYIIENVTGDKVCNPVKCPDVTIVAKSNMNENAVLYYPGSLTISCLEGYSIDATASASSQVFTVECQTDGSLTPVSECHPIHCGIAPTMLNAASAPDASREFVFGEQAKYTCPEGYTLNGKSAGQSELKLKCGANGQFPPMEKTCKPVTCGAPPPIENAAATATRVDFGSSASYQCHVGYALDANNPDSSTFSRACLASGAFEAIAQQESGEQQQCSHKSCSDLGWSDQTHVGCGMFLGGLGIEGTCGGVGIQGCPGCSHKCQGSGSYDQAKDFCESLGARLCNEEEMLNLEGAGNGCGYDREYVWTDTPCNGGHMTVNVGGCGKTPTSTCAPVASTAMMGRCCADATCPLGKKQLYESTKCVRISCGVPPAASGAQHDFGDHEAFFEDAVHYECGTGHSVDGSPTGAKEWSITCTETGSFSPPLATACQAISFKVTGKVTDATNLLPVVGAQVQINLGAQVVATEITDSSGHFEAEGVPMGTVHIKSSKNQYVVSDKDLIVQKNIMSGEKADLQMSPVLPPDGWRVVLTWSDKPRDLDAHFYYGPAQACHVYYGAKNVHCNGIGASLDVDDVNGNGPETITLHSVSTSCHSKSTCKLYFKVHNWSGHPHLHSTTALVALYNGNHKVAEYKLENGDGTVSSRWWSVFELDGKRGTVRACTDFACGR